MSTILTARYHRGRSWLIINDRKKEREERRKRENRGRGRNWSSPPLHEIHGKSVSNQTPIDSATKINQYHRASTQVR